MTKKLKASVSSNSMPDSPTRSDAAHNADHAPADLRAWYQELVARGDRLVELAIREREGLRRSGMQQSDHPTPQWSIGRVRSGD